LGNVLSLAMPDLADLGCLDLVDDSGVIRHCRSHEDPHRDTILAASRWEGWPRTDTNLCALSSGEPVIHSSVDDVWYATIGGGPQVELLRALAVCSMLAVPLRVDRRVIGALTLYFASSGRHHTSEDLTRAEELAHWAAPAIQNARVHRELRREMERCQE